MTQEQKAARALTALYTALNALEQSCASEWLIEQMLAVVKNAEVELDLSDD